MASSSTQKPSSSSAPTPKCNFDVFLSFRGEDTRYNFTDHLFENLKRVGINTFRDNKLERGGEIAQELLESIEGSRFSIIVFSENYADSKWCLDELAKIMECRKKKDQIVLPVFYHVDPSDVRKQTGSFGKAFAKHGTTVDEEKVKRWKAAMTEASFLIGWHVKDYEYESKYIDKILKDIRKRLGPKHLHVGNDIVGMDSRLEELKSLINRQSRDVCVVGIYGTGGIGKTTTAKIVYYEIQCEFNGASFLENVKESFKKSCQLQLLEQLLHGIGGEKIKLSNIDEGLDIIKNTCSSKKVLIVIDDVDHMGQLESLIGSRDWFGAGTRIIITTRDQHLLDCYEANERYEVKNLDDAEAIQLFSKHAFKENAPKEDYVKLSKCMVVYAQGLPLALKVLGSSLRGMTIDEWKNALDKLKNNLMEEIYDVLRISFDMLDCSQKKVFLDIACFFKGKDKAFVLKILDSCNLYAKCNIKVLCDKCLITFSRNMIQMHDLIQQMGWTIVREECLGKPSKWSRLWDLDDIHKALSAQEGMEQVEAISYDLSRSKEMQVNKQVFESMKNLRFLKLHWGGYHGFMTKTNEMFLPKDFEFPSQELRCLYWEGYPLQTLPSKFNGENLVELRMINSTIKQLWKGRKVLGNLKIIDLCFSRLLTKMPELSSMPNLEELYLTDCKRLKKFPKIRRNMGRLESLYLDGSGIQEIPSSIEYLPALEVLSLGNCRKFDKFPDNFGNSRHLRFIHAKKADIEELPNSFGYLESPQNPCLDDCSNLEKEIHVMKRLEHLDLSGTAIKKLPNAFGCLEALKVLDLSGCSNFEEFPEIQNMGSLRDLFLNKTAIKELPCSIGHLTKLRELDLQNCKNLRSLPNSICGLKSLAFLYLNGCSNLVAFPKIKEDMKHLQELLLSKTPITELPPSIEHLKGLRRLELNNCEKLVTLPDSIGNLTHLTSLELKNCEKLVTLPDSIGNLTHLTRLELKNCEKLVTLPHSIGNLTHLTLLELNNCEKLVTLPDSIGNLTHFTRLELNNCEKLVTLPHSIGNLTHLRRLELNNCEKLVTLPDSIGNLTHLTRLELKNCEKLVTLPNSIGNLTHLRGLCVRNCSKLHNLPDNLRSLACCLRTLDLAGCNLMKGAIPSDLWCLSSLRFLDVSEIPIPCIPTNIIQLSNLRTLRMNHCQILEEFPELPSRLEVLEAQGCPHLGTLSTPSSPLWSSLLNLFKSRTQSCEYEIDSNSLWYFHVPKVVIPGSGGIPEWISHQSMGRQAIIELPKNRYEDNNFLGFAVFFHHVPLDELHLSTDGRFLQFELRISHDDQSERVIKIMSCFHLETCSEFAIASEGICYDNGSTSDPPLCVTYLPKFAIPSEHRYAKHRLRLPVVEVEICGIHLIYSKNDHQQNQSHGPEAMRIHIRKDQDISCDFEASPYRFHRTKDLDIVVQELPEWSESEWFDTEGSESENSDYYSADEGDPTVGC